MVYVCIETQKGKFQDVLDKVRKRKYLTASANKTLNEIDLNFKGIGESSTKFKEIKDILTRMHGVENVEIVRGFLKAKDTKLKEAFRTNNCRLILDIDSTITRGGAGTIHPSVPPILQKIKDKGIWVYVATGRSLSDLTNIVNQNPIEPHSIAENGGIILGFAKDNYLEFGSKDEPRKVLEYLQARYSVREDL